MVLKRKFVISFVTLISFKTCIPELYRILNISERTSCSDSDVYHYVIIIRKLFQRTVGTEIVIPQMLLKTQNFCSVRLAAQSMTYS
jgi:hypothetical protein